MRPDEISQQDPRHPCHRREHEQAPRPDGPQPLRRLGDGQQIEVQRRTAKTPTGFVNGGQND